MIRPVAAIIAALLLFGPLLVAELGTRALIKAGRLPEAPSSRPETDVSLANIERIGRPDVLVVGTSTIRSGLRPNVLEDLIHDATGKAVSIQTVAQPALSLEAQRILVGGLASKGLVPRLVILGLNSSTMTGFGSDGDWFPQSELARLWGGCPDVEGISAVSCAFGRRSALWRWRGDGARLTAALAGEAPRTFGDKDRRLTKSGWLSERPVRKYTLEQRVPRLLPDLPAGVPLPRQNLESFRALIDELRSHGATVVAVAMPYAAQLEEALLERNPDWYAEREAGYAALGEAAGLPITTVDEFGDWWETRSQNDLRHLSRTGAAHFTRQLWDLPTFREPILEVLTSAD